MPRLQLAGSPTPAPQSGQPAPTPTHDPRVTNEHYTPIGGSIDSVRQEIDDVFEAMKEFHNQEPDEVMRLCGGYSARLAEFRVRIQRIEDFHRIWKNVRIREIEPAMEQLTVQFQIASRLLAARELDFKIETGMR